MHDMQIVLSSGRSFHASPDCSILDAAAQAGIALPYGCRTGRCSTCRCKVLSGSTKLLRPESGLTAQEAREGWILSCVRAPLESVHLELDDLGGVELPRNRTWPCKISRIDRVTDQIVRVFLRLPPTALFDYLPGQYIELIGPNGVRRSYSLANARAADHTLELHIRAVEGGAFSRYWFQEAQVDDLLRLNGPLGTFFLRETRDTDLIFLATGTGIAPIKAMLESLREIPTEQQPKSVTVLWGGRRRDDFYLDFAISAAAYTYIPVHSRPETDWRGASGYVQDVLMRSRPDWSRSTVYACGSEIMIRSAKQQLVEAGLAPNRFYSDAFVCSSASNES